MSELTWDTLYIDHADAYEVLVSHEDYQGNLLRAIQAVQPLAGKNSAEFGCGTGLLAGSVRKLHAFDFTASMLRLAWARLHLRNWTHVSLTLADSRRMPVRSGGRLILIKTPGTGDSTPKFSPFLRTVL